MRAQVSSSSPSTVTSPERRRRWLYDLWFEERQRRRAMRLLGLASLVFILFAAFFSFQGGVPGFDQAISQEMQQWDTVPFVTVSEIVSKPGYSPWNGLIAAALCILVGWWRGWRVGLYLTVITLTQGLIGVLLKFPIRIERPIGSNLEAPLAVIRESSFPSGHVTLYVVLFGFVVYLLWKHAVPALLRGAATILAVVLIVLIGPSRVHLGAHWVGDVVAAYLLGFFFLLVGIEVYERWLLPHGEHRGEKKG